MCCGMTRRATHPHQHIQRLPKQLSLLDSGLYTAGVMNALLAARSGGGGGDFCLLPRCELGSSGVPSCERRMRRNTSIEL